MTKFERNKHKKLVDELKERKRQGEENLIIRNGTIVKRPPRRHPHPVSAEIVSSDVHSPPIVQSDSNLAQVDSGPMQMNSDSAQTDSTNQST